MAEHIDGVPVIEETPEVGSFVWYCYEHPIKGKLSGSALIKAPALVSDVNRDARVMRLFVFCPYTGMFVTDCSLDARQHPGWNPIIKGVDPLNIYSLTTRARMVTK